MAAVELSEMEAKDINTKEDLTLLKLLYKFRTKRT